MGRLLRTTLVSFLLIPLSAIAFAEKKEPKVEDWTAPTYWTVSRPASVLAKEGIGAAALQTVPFVALSPCRLVDTRPESGFPPPYGPPFLSPGVTRDFQIAGHCGVPVGATAVSFNFTVVRTQGLGYLATYPQGESWPGTSTLNYVAGQIVANNAATALGSTGALTVFVSGAQSDLIIDINGYYGGALVNSLNGLSGDLTLAAGDNVTITPSGGVLTLSATSIPGPTGPPGPQGVPGATGPAGPQGPIGLTGNTGPTGPAGPQGIQGLVGPIGPQGTQGAVGPTGPAGAQGEQGSQGPAGQAGMTFRGAWDVETTYAIGDAIFFNGSSYVSLVDANGGNSPDASPSQWAMLAQQGSAGANGADGSQGIQGIPGSMGPQGLTGATGAIGPQGPAGTAGAQGEQGSQGPAGQAGMTFRGAWDVETTYAIGDAIFFNGSSYISLVDANVGNTPDASPSQWAMLAQQGSAGATGADGSQGIQGLPGSMGPQGLTGAAGSTGATGPQGPAGIQGAQGATGPQGPQGPPISFKGEWAVPTMYAAGDAVSFGGSSYISLFDANAGHQPDTSPGFWGVLALEGLEGSQGADGAPGPSGAPGSVGPIGPMGPAGAGGYQSLHDLDDASGTRYMSPLSTYTSSNQSGQAIALVPRACTMTSIVVFVTTPVRNGGTEVFTLRLGTTFVATGESGGTTDIADTALTCSIFAAGQSCSSSAAIPVDVGELIDLKVVVSGGQAPSTHDALVALLCE